MYVLIVGVLIFAFMRLPSAFLPEEDQGMLIALVQLPVGSSQEQTIEVLKKIEDHFLDNESDAVQSMFAAAGFSFSGRGQNSGIAFIRLKDWDERDLEKDGVQAIVGRAWGAFSQIREAFVFAINPPAIPALGVASGFNFQFAGSQRYGARRR